MIKYPIEFSLGLKNYNSNDLIDFDFCIYSTNNLELNKVIETAKTNCFIANSVKSQLNWNIKYTDENF